MFSHPSVTGPWIRMAIGTGGALVLALPASAQEASPAVAEAAVVVDGGAFGPIANGVLADPLFLPPKGKLYGSGVASITLAGSDSYAASGGLLYSETRHDVGLSHALSYGVTRRFSLHGSLGYSFNFADDTAPNGVVTKSSGRTFNNSGLGATWRAIDQRTHPFVLDLTLNYAPTFFISDPSVRPAVNASVGIGRAMRAFTVQLIGAGTWRPTNRYVATDGRTEIEQRSTADYTVALRTQFRFSPSLSTDASINYALSASHLTIDHTNQLSSGEDAPSVLTLSTGLNYQVVRDRLAVGAYYSRQFQSDSASTSSDPSQNGFTRNAARSVITGKIYYLIN